MCPKNNTTKEKFKDMSKLNSEKTLNTENTEKTELPASEPETGKVSRRNFVKVASTAAALSAVLPLLSDKQFVVEASTISYDSRRRARASSDYRVNTADDEFFDVGVQPDNGDAARFTDGSFAHTKALVHDGLGVPNAASFQSLKHAFTTGLFSDFENIIVGTPGGGGNSKLNGPQVALAFDLEGLDSHATVIPPSPSVASAITAAEEVEHYWAALLR